MDNETIHRLVAEAAKAREFAAAQYSGFKVGAALLSANGSITAGVNVESASYGLTCCAERVALFSAVTSGTRDFLAVAIVARIEGGPMPCGACRQLLLEYAPRALVLTADTAALGEVRHFEIQQLLPAAFLHVPVVSPAPQDCL